MKGCWETSLSRYWFDSFPGIDLDVSHPVLDFYGTPYGGPECTQLGVITAMGNAFGGMKDRHAPYTTVSQNRGGVA